MSTHGVRNTCLMTVEPVPLNYSISPQEIESGQCCDSYECCSPDSQCIETQSEADLATKRRRFLYALPIIAILGVIAFSMSISMYFSQGNSFLLSANNKYPFGHSEEII